MTGSAKIAVDEEGESEQSSGVQSAAGGDVRPVSGSGTRHSILDVLRGPLAALRDECRALSPDQRAELVVSATNETLPYLPAGIYDAKHRAKLFALLRAVAGGGTLETRATSVALAFGCNKVESRVVASILSVCSSIARCSADVRADNVRAVLGDMSAGIEDAVTHLSGRLNKLVDALTVDGVYQGGMKLGESSAESINPMFDAAWISSLQRLGSELTPELARYRGAVAAVLAEASRTHAVAVRTKQQVKDAASRVKAAVKRSATKYGIAEEMFDDGLEAILLGIATRNPDSLVDMIKERIERLRDQQRIR